MTWLGFLQSDKVIDGLFQPVGTIVSNISDFELYLMGWMRVGSTIICVGAVQIDPTSNNQNTVLDITLPFDTTFITERLAQGTIIGDAESSVLIGNVRAMVGTSKARMSFNSRTYVAPFELNYRFMYRV